MQTNHNQKIGNEGENLVLEHYLKQGFSLLAKNFNCYESNKLGEIDLIVIKENKLHLVEVKTRTNQKFGLPEMQITKKKLKSLYRSYLKFIQTNQKFKEFFVQFDMASILDQKLVIYSNCYSFEDIL